MLDLLEIVLAERSCNLTTAAALAELTPTTALRHLRALEARGYLDRNASGIFTAGPTVRRIAASVHDGGPLDRMIDMTQPHLDALAGETGESTYLAVRGRGLATYLATAESQRAIRHVGWVGQNLPLDGTAVGGAFASPGTVVVETGAVEPDITAISLALPRFESLMVAISVVGPAHRLDLNAQKAAAVALIRTVDAVCVDLGIENDYLDEDVS